MHYPSTTDAHSRKLQAHTMRRVYTVWFMRRVLPIFALEVATLVFVLSSVQSYMSFESFFSNFTQRAMNYSVGNFLYYLQDIVIHTEHMIKFLAIGAGAAAWLVIRDAIRVTKQVRGNFLRVRRVN